MTCSIARGLLCEIQSSPSPVLPLGKDLEVANVGFYTDRILMTEERENVTLGDEGGHHEGRQGGAVGKVLSK